MKFWVNLGLSLVMLVVCVWLVWPDAADKARIIQSLQDLDRGFLPYLGAYLALQAVVHFSRSWRWRSLLAPLGVKIGAVPLLAISSAGFLAILALPARLGELVRPALLRANTTATLAESLGAVAVERIIDGLLVSLMVFVTFFAHHNASSPAWMMPTAYVALLVFTTALGFLVVGWRRPLASARFASKVLLLQRFSPRLAKKLEDLVLAVIRGFAALASHKEMLTFVAWSLCYWAANAISIWILARGFGLPLSVEGAFASMGLLAIGITLPNAPVMAGQYQAFIVQGMSLYIGDSAHAEGLAFAMVLHALQVIWYTALGGLSFLTPYVSFAKGRIGGTT